jgi:hypothetical protein
MTFDHPRIWRRDFDDGLVGLDLDDGLVGFDRIALGYQPSDYLRFGEAFTDVWKSELATH